MKTQQPGKIVGFLAAASFFSSNNRTKADQLKSRPDTKDLLAQVKCTIDSSMDLLAKGDERIQRSKEDLAKIGYEISASKEQVALSRELRGASPGYNY